MSDSSRSLHYAFEPHVIDEEPCLEVTLTILGEAGGVTELLLPSDWGGLVNLHEGIRGLCALTPEATIEASDEPHLKKVFHSPSTFVDLEYFVFNAPKSVENSFKPILTPNWFHLIRYEFLVSPRWDDDLLCTVTLDWNNLPTDWTTANSFGTECRIQEFSASLEDLRSAVYVSGDYRVLLIDNQSTFLALRGAWQFSDEALCHLTRQILDMEKSFWGDDSLPYFLITLTPGEAGGFAGVGQRNSFLVLVTPDASLNDLKGLLAHELFHRWHPGQMLLVGPRDNYGWFYEGFTNFYVRRLLLRANLLSSEDFLKEYNETLFGYYSSPFSGFTPQQIQDAYEDKTMSLDRRFYALAYQKGEILASHWNGRIQAASQGKSSLDDVMRELLRIARTNNGQVSESDFIALCDSHGCPDVSEDLQEYIDAGQIISLDADAVGPNITLNTLSRLLFDPGFDYGLARRTKKIQRVQHEGPAYQAGLRDGQEYVGDNYRFDPNREASVVIKEEGEERTINYYPQGSTGLIPQYEKLFSSFLES